MTSLPGTSESKAMRVIPSFPDKLTKVLSGIHLSSALLLFGVGGAAFTIKAFTSVAGTSILAGVALLVSGSLGFAAGFRKEIWAISMFLIFSVIALTMNLALVATGTIGYHTEHKRKSAYSQNTREIVDVSAIALAVLGSLITLVAIGLSCHYLFFGCCHRVTGATYINEPNVEYSVDKDEISIENVSVEKPLEEEDP